MKSESFSARECYPVLTVKIRSKPRKPVRLMDTCGRALAEPARTLDEIHEQVEANLVQIRSETLEHLEEARLRCAAVHLGANKPNDYQAKAG